MKAKIHVMPERGTQVTMNGVGVGPKVSERDAEVICRWISKTWKHIVTYVRRADLKKLEGWQCPCACHRLRQATYHCIGCSDGKYKT